MSTRLATLLLPALLSGCAATVPYAIDLMPAPEVYDPEAINPFADDSRIRSLAYPGILYATDRRPVDQTVGAHERDHAYENARGHLVRLGLAEIALGDNPMNWKEAREVSLLKNRTGNYPLRVTSVEEFGILNSSLTALTRPLYYDHEISIAGSRFAEMVDKQLARSPRQEIFVYVHGYKVMFDNPILVAAELWHYLGYDGAFIAYAWPSTPSRWAYFSDLETTSASSRHFRVFLEYLARETQAKHIHIIGYSAGTRLVAQTLHQMALMNQGMEGEDRTSATSTIGEVILVGSDVDRQVFGGYLVDGLLDIPQRLTLYTSSRDKALGLSRWLFTRERLGQTLDPSNLIPDVREQLAGLDKMVMVDVTEAEGSTTGNGHAYFRQSPWASSDILMTLRYGLSPEDRGLIRGSDEIAWTFPEDYIPRLRRAIGRHLALPESNRLDP